MLPISTIYVVGFPLEVFPRDLKNFCRFLPGFVDAHVPPCAQTEPPVLFAKFQNADLAVAAIQRIHGQPFDMDAPERILSAELARRDMEVRAGSAVPRQPAVAVSSPAMGRGVTTYMASSQPMQQVSHTGLAGFKRPYAGEEEIVTVTVLGTRDKGFTLESLQEWFQQLPGFIALQVNEKIDGIFVKFASRFEAEHAMGEAKAQNLAAEWARRNLDENGAPAPTPSPASSPPAMSPPAMSPPMMSPPAMSPPPFNAGLAPGMPPAKRPCAVEGGELTTITVLSMREKGLRQEELESWFRKRSGFMGIQANTRLDGVFVKFATGFDAEKALAEANNKQYRAEWARRNLDLGKEYELNTITVLGAREKGLSMDELQMWFQQRPGFQTLKVNERIDGLFVKYLSGADAAQAITDANAMQIRAEWARRNLD